MPSTAAAILPLMRALPLAGLDEIAPGTSMVIAPHADDESLGCAGLIAAACDAGRPPLVVLVSDGTKSHPHSVQYPAPRLRAVREAELLDAVAALGLLPERVTCLGLPDTAVPTAGPGFDAAVDRLVALVVDHKVSTLLVTWPYDPHCDHTASAAIAQEVSRRTGALLRYYPVWGWLLPDDAPLPDGAPGGWRLDITAALGRKRRAVQAHASQYAGLITDDPTGFSLPAPLLAVFERPFEVYLLP